MVFQTKDNDNDNNNDDDDDDDDNNYNRLSSLSVCYPLSTALVKE